MGWGSTTATPAGRQVLFQMSPFRCWSSCLFLLPLWSFGLPHLPPALTQHFVICLLGWSPLLGTCMPRVVSAKLFYFRSHGLPETAYTPPGIGDLSFASQSCLPVLAPAPLSPPGVGVTFRCRTCLCSHPHSPFPSSGKTLLAPAPILGLCLSQDLVVPASAQSLGSEGGQSWAPPRGPFSHSGSFLMPRF